MSAQVKQLQPPTHRDSGPSRRISGGQTYRWLLWMAAALIFYAYFVQKTVALGIHGAIRRFSIMEWLWIAWGGGREQEYAHGFIVPLVTVGLVMWKWHKLFAPNLHFKDPVARPALASAAGYIAACIFNWPRVAFVALAGMVYGAARIFRAHPADAARDDGANLGLWIVGVSVFLYWVGVRAAVPRVTVLSLITLIGGATVYFAGKSLTRQFVFPLAFLLFMIPVNFLEAPIAFPLRLLAAQVATVFLNLIGIPAVRDGTAILNTAGGQFGFDVADPCSGIRSLVAMAALTAVYGYVTLDAHWKKWVLFFAAMPLAVLGNLTRIVTVALVARGFGEDIASKVYHDYSGYIVFGVAIICMLAVAASMNLRYRELLHKWTQEQVVHPRRR